MKRASLALVLAIAASLCGCAHDPTFNEQLQEIVIQAMENDTTAVCETVRPLLHDQVDAFIDETCYGEDHEDER